MRCLRTDGVLLLLIFLFRETCVYSYRIPVGVIVGENDDAYLSAIKYAVYLHESQRSAFKVELIVKRTNSDDIYEMDKAVCNILRQGVFILMAPTTFATYNTLSSYSNNFHLPLISPSFPDIPPELSMKYGIGILPTPIRATLDLMRYNNWNSIIYLYDSEDGSETLQKILLLAADVFRVTVLGMHRITNTDDAITYIRKIDIDNRKADKQVILKTNTTLAREIITMFMHDSHIQKEKYNFLFMELVLNNFWEKETEGIRNQNITGFRLINPQNEKLVQFKRGWTHFVGNGSVFAGSDDVLMKAILGYDGALLVLDTIETIMRKQYSANPPLSSILNGTKKQCFRGQQSYWKHGHLVSQYLKETVVPAGVTGSLQFDGNGQRKFYALEVIKTTPIGPERVATWSDVAGFRSLRSPSYGISSRLRKDAKLIITTVLNGPYMILKKGSRYTGNDRYEGYCKDLLDLLIKELGHGSTYEIKLVADSKYGAFDKSTGKWNGMIGEVVSGNADLAIADLTVTTNRSKVVHFSQPFQTIGISLMLKKPGSRDISPLETTPFFFLYVFTKEVWICIIITYVVITALLYLITRFTLPPDRAKVYEVTSENKLSVNSSIWFVMGTCLLRGVGIYPKSVSTRVLSCIWWAFTLTIISLYIANAATILVAHRVGGESGANVAALSIKGIHAVLEEAVNSGSPALGCLAGGSTYAFFQSSKLPLYKKIYENMEQNPEYLFMSTTEAVEKVRRENGKFGAFVESPTNEYISHREPCDTMMVPGTLDSKSYGIATQTGSPLSSEIDAALRKLQETGHLNQLYDKWWLRTSECARRYTRNLENLYHDSMTIWEISGLFYVLLIGVALVIAITAAEYFYCTRRNASRQTKSGVDETQT